MVIKYLKMTPTKSFTEVHFFKYTKSSDLKDIFTEKY